MRLLLFGFSERNGFKRTLITIDTIHGKITLDRTFAGQSFAEKYGTIRETKIRKNKSVQLTILLIALLQKSM